MEDLKSELKRQNSIVDNLLYTIQCLKQENADLKRRQSAESQIVLLDDDQDLHGDFQVRSAQIFQALSVRSRVILSQYY